MLSIDWVQVKLLMDIWTAKALTGMRILPGTYSFFFELSDLIVDRYEGSFCKSQRHGYGEYFFADGSCGAE